jgi:hypothetical protein
MNSQRRPVGFDVEMAQLLARDLGVRLELIEMEDAPGWQELLVAGRIDLAMTGIAVTAERAGALLFSQPYLDETFAFVVKDHLREEFSAWANIRGLGDFPVTIPDLPYYIEALRARAPALKLQTISSVKQIESGLQDGSLDAVVLPAERGSVLTLLSPEIHGRRSRTRGDQDSACVPRGRRRSEIRFIPQHVDRAQTQRRHHRRPLRPLDSRQTSRPPRAALVGDAQRPGLG